MKRKGESLLQHMSALEVNLIKINYQVIIILRQHYNLFIIIKNSQTYPPVNAKLVGPRSDYSDAKEYFREYPGQKLIGTLSKSEWEVCSK